MDDNDSKKPDEVAMSWSITSQHQIVILFQPFYFNLSRNFFFSLCRYVWILFPEFDLDSQDRSLPIMGCRRRVPLMASVKIFNFMQQIRVSCACMTTSNWIFLTILLLLLRIIFQWIYFFFLYDILMTCVFLKFYACFLMQYNFLFKCNIAWCYIKKKIYHVESILVNHNSHIVIYKTLVKGSEKCGTLSIIEHGCRFKLM